MEVFVILLFAVGIFLLYSKGPTFLNQYVFSRGGHSKGKSLAAQKHGFTTSASKKDVAQAIARGVPAELDAPLLLPKLHRVESSDLSVSFAFGNRWMSVFSLIVILGSTGGSYQVIKVMETNGVVARQKEMEQLVSNIESSIRRLDPKATFTVF